MVDHIDGLRCAEINENTAGGEYDLVFYSELRDADRQIDVVGTPNPKCKNAAAML